MSKPSSSWGYQPEPPIIVCDDLGPDFTLTADISLEWSAGSNTPLANKKVPLKPNSGAPPTPFSLDIPSDVLKSKPKSYSSLVLKFKTAYQNGTEFGVTSTEYLTLIEREHIVIQSDKAKYKPGNLVQFRVLMMDVNLIPFEATSIEYTIESPSNNKMAMKTLTNPGQVVTGSFPLDKYAEQGGWSIPVEATTANGKIEAVYAFDVEEQRTTNMIPKNSNATDKTQHLNLNIENVTRNG